MDAQHKGKKVEVEVLVDNPCGITIRFPENDDKIEHVETFTEAVVQLYKDKNGKILIIDVEYDPGAPTC